MKLVQKLKNQFFPLRVDPVLAELRRPGKQTDRLKYSFSIYSEAPVDKWVKRWPTDLAVPSSSPIRGEIFSTVNGVPLHAAVHYHPPIVLI